jgi:hypothetical protein
MIITDFLEDDTSLNAKGTGTEGANASLINTSKVRLKNTCLLLASIDFFTNRKPEISEGLTL